MDILDQMSEPPAQINYEDAQIAVFGYDEKYHGTDATIILYDDSEFFENFEKDEILELVSKRKLEGIEIDTDDIRKMLILILDSYTMLRQEDPSLENRLKLSGKMFDLLEKIRVL